MSFQKRKEYNRFNNNRYQPYNNQYTRIDDDNNKQSYNMQLCSPSLMEETPTITYNTDDFYCPTDQGHYTNEMISNRHVYNEPIQRNMMNQYRNKQFTTADSNHHFQTESISTSKRSWEQFNGSNERTKKSRHNDTEQQHQYQQNWRSSEINTSSQNANIEPIDSNDPADMITTTETNINKQYTIPIFQLQRAVGHKLPCFIIDFDKTIAEHNLPHKKVACKLIKDHLNRNNIKINDFSTAFFSGHRLRVGVDNLEDYSQLAETDKWPTTINNVKVELMKPKFVPECFTVVVKDIPQEISIATVVDETKRSLNSADYFKSITYSYTRPTKHIKFTVSNLDEYRSVLQLGSLRIGNRFYQVTKFTPPEKLTYCSKCWKLGHLRYNCNLNVRKCQICLETFDDDHKNKCSGKPVCAQCGLDHHSLDVNCEYIRKYRETLKQEVRQAIQDGTINPQYVD